MGDYNIDNTPMTNLRKTLACLFETSHTYIA